MSELLHTLEGGVGHELHLELDPVVASRLALLGEGRGAAHRRDEVNVAAAAHAARAHHDAFARTGEVGDLPERLERLVVELGHHRARGHLEDEVLPVLAVLARALAVRAAGGAEVVLEAVVDERRELRVALEDDVAATAAVAAVGSALGDEGLAAKRHAAGAAVTAAHVDPRDIGELRHLRSLLGIHT